MNDRPYQAPDEPKKDELSADGLDSVTGGSLGQAMSKGATTGAITSGTQQPGGVGQIRVDDYKIPII